MLIIKLKGGIGNQMFQYAFGRRLAIETGEVVKLDAVNGFRNDAFERTYSLNNYCIALETASAQNLKKYNFYNRTIAGRIIEKTKKAVNENKGYIVKEQKQFSYVKEYFEEKKEKYYDGYWQNAAYFESIREILLTEFSLTRNDFSDIAQLADELQKSDSVAVHIRNPHAYINGQIDFNTLQKFVILEPDYYKKAIKYIVSKYESSKLYLFCENLDYALNILKGVNIEKVIQSKDYLDVILMSKCKHQIISNSTFSWWAAWLNTNKEKNIISPKYWYKDHSIKLDSILDGYITI